MPEVRAGSLASPTPVPCVKVAACSHFQPLLVVALAYFASQYVTQYGSALHWGPRRAIASRGSLLRAHRDRESRTAERE